MAHQMPVTFDSACGLHFAINTEMIVEHKLWKWHGKLFRKI